MVKVNLLKKEGNTEETLPPVEEITVETPKPEKKEKSKKSGNKGGALKIILILLVVGAIGGSGYLAYLQGWFSGGSDSTTVDTMVIADETPMDSPEKPKVIEKPATKPTPKKLSTIDKKPEQSRSTEKSNRAVKRSPDKTVQKRGSELSQVTEGRILLDVFNSIISSVNESMSNMKLTVSSSRVTLALGMNTREEAALLLRNIRQKWPTSNLRAVRFESPKSAVGYAFATQFSGSVQFKGIVPKSGDKKRNMLKAEPFKNRLTTLTASHGLKLIKFKTSSAVQMRGGSSIPITITASGSNESISKFIDSLAKLDVAYGISRASIQSNDSATSTISLYLHLIRSNSKASS